MDGRRGGREVVVGGGEKPSDVVFVGTKSSDATYAKDMNVLVLTGEVAQIRNVRLTNEKGSFGSSGVRMSGGLLENCEVVECYRLNNSGQGGGIYLTGGTVRDCLVSNNCARSSGGCGSWGNGIYMEGGLVENCRILDNEKPVNGKLQAYGNAHDATGGGGVFMKGGILRGCLVKGNTHTGKGTGVFAAYGTIENCTIVENGFETSTGAGVILGKVNGADNVADGCVLFRNNIVRDNFDSTGETNVTGNIEGCTTEANCTKPALPTGTGNIDVDPLLDANCALGDSACVDGGVWAAWMEGAVDLAGQLRAPKGRPDIGCYERPAPTGFLLIIR